MKPLLLVPFLLLSIFATAQTTTDYQVESRDSNFILIQNGQAVPFDTAQVQINLQQKTEEVSAIETEISLLERLVMLRRQLAVARDEQRTLVDIIEKARKCETPSSKN